MMRFDRIFPELAARETRSWSLAEPVIVADATILPADDYGFFELYCTERGCDCRRVMVNVVSRKAMAQVATINHAFDKPGKKAVIEEQTFLDPLNVQSRWSEALLGVFVHVVLADPAYRERLSRHYQMFKDAVQSPTHPCQRILREAGAGL